MQAQAVVAPASAMWLLTQGAQLAEGVRTPPLVLRVEVTLVGAPGFVPFSPSDKASPPYRLINRTHTPVYCNQTGVPVVTTRAKDVDVQQ